MIDHAVEILNRYTHSFLMLEPHDTDRHKCGPECLEDMKLHSGTEYECSHPTCVAWRAFLLD